LILDEATASVDTVTEALIQDAMYRLLKGRTSIVIAHRLSTVRTADLICVLQNGQIIERGRHEELLARGGLYANLVARQYLDASAAEVGEAERPDINIRPDIDVRAKEQRPVNRA
jgi:ABC-type multidrug transport system fused ATPase/permease subunit